MSKYLVSVRLLVSDHVRREIFTSQRSSTMYVHRVLANGLANQPKTSVCSTGLNDCREFSFKLISFLDFCILSHRWFSLLAGGDAATPCSFANGRTAPYARSPLPCASASSPLTRYTFLRRIVFRSIHYVRFLSTKTLYMHARQRQSIYYLYSPCRYSLWHHFPLR